MLLTSELFSAVDFDTQLVQLTTRFLSGEVRHPGSQEPPAGAQVRSAGGAGISLAREAIDPIDLEWAVRDATDLLFTRQPELSRPRSGDFARWLEARPERRDACHMRPTVPWGLCIPDGSETLYA